MGRPLFFFLSPLFLIPDVFWISGFLMMFPSSFTETICSEGGKNCSSCIHSLPGLSTRSSEDNGVKSKIFNHDTQVSSHTAAGLTLQPHCPLPMPISDSEALIKAVLALLGFIMLSYESVVLSILFFLAIRP